MLYNELRYDSTGEYTVYLWMPNPSPSAWDKSKGCYINAMRRGHLLTLNNPRKGMLVREAETKQLYKVVNMGTEIVPDPLKIKSEDGFYSVPAVYLKEVDG